MHNHKIHQLKPHRDLHLLVVDGSTSGNFTEDHDHTGLGASLTCYTRQRILLDASIKDSVGHLIANLICKIQLLRYMVILVQKDVQTKGI